MGVATGNVFTSPDPAGSTGTESSLVLDGNGNPVVSYFLAVDRDLKVLHCGDATCSSGNVITSPDTADSVGSDTSLALDGGGNPVISYRDQTNGDLKVLHCGDPNCNAGNVITSPDTAGNVGSSSSLALDGSGNPVISYHGIGDRDLKLLHCGDATCSSGNVITSPDTAGDVGRDTSLVLDAAGNPVVSYRHNDSDDLKLLHCGDATCSSGNVISTPDTAGDPRDPSLVLDSAGNPVVGYYDEAIGDLKILFCGNPNCSAGNVITSPVTVGDVGEEPSLVLDGDGNPVVSYCECNDDDLTVLHCGDVHCGASPAASPTPTAAPGEDRVWGDGNCSGSADPIDSLLTLRFDAGLPTNTGDCPDFGQVVEVADASPHPWGDVDCSGEISPVDSLKILRNDAGLGVTQAAGCPLLGAQVNVAE